MRNQKERRSLDMDYPIKVNGIEMVMPQENVICHDILELAKKHDAIPGKVEDYDLRGEAGHRYRQDDWGDVSTDKEFISLVNQPTPVA